MWAEIQEALISIGLWDKLLVGASIFVPTMGIVYTMGKMLDFVRTDRAKNSVALFSIIFIATFRYYVFDNLVFTPIVIWNLSFDIFVAILYYVLLGFKLYTRIDTLLDKKLPDIEKPKKKR